MLFLLPVFIELTTGVDDTVGVGLAVTVAVGEGVGVGVGVGEGVGVGVGVKVSRALLNSKGPESSLPSSEAEK